MYQSENVGDLVYISDDMVGSDFSVRKVDVTDFAKMPAVAIVTFKLSPTKAVIQFTGEITLLTGLTPGKIYWVGNDGTITADPNLNPGVGQRRYLQPIGIALDSGVLKLDFSKDLKVRIG